MLRRVLAALSLALGIVGLAAPVAADGEQVARLELTGVIDQVNAAFIEEAPARRGRGGRRGGDHRQIDSPGGELTSMDRIIKAILASEVPVIAWVAPEGARAASAATFVTLAADVAAMAPNTNIGAASVVGSGGEELPETLAAKVTNDAVARIRSLADEHGRNADWAESAVRDAASISATEAVAMEPPVADLIAGDLPALLAAVDSGERADGYAYTFNGEPLPPLSRPADPRPRDERRPAVPPPAERPEHRLHPVHHRLLRDHRRAVPPELLLGHPRRDRDRARLHRLERAAAQRRAACC